MIIELSVAGTFAVILSIVLYTKEKNRQNVDALQNKVMNLEHQVNIKQLEHYTKKLEALTKSQNELINELKPIIERQSKIISDEELLKIQHEIIALQRLLYILNRLELHISQVVRANPSQRKYHASLNNVLEYAKQISNDSKIRDLEINESAVRLSLDLITKKGEEPIINLNNLDNLETYLKDISELIFKIHERSHSLRNERRYL